MCIYYISSRYYSSDFEPCEHSGLKTSLQLKNSLLNYVQVKQQCGAQNVQIET
jgi:hypothetical protein